ncbi:MAG: LamG-like jellyroll fold domain-containing protein [Candidatus Limnocylindria bacterium]
MTVWRVLDPNPTQHATNNGTLRVSVTSGSGNKLFAWRYLTGVNQAQPESATGTNSGTGPTSSVSATSADLVVDAAGYVDSNVPTPNPVPGAGQQNVLVRVQNNAFGQSDAAMGSSTHATSPTWDFGGSYDWVAVAVAVRGLGSPGPLAEQLYGLGRSGHGRMLARFELDPVNTALGNYAYDATDLSLPGSGLGFAFTRTYNSLDATVGTLGPGWTHSYAARLAFAPAGAVRFHAEDGAQLVYVPDGSGGFDAPTAAYSALAQLGDGTFELTRRDQVTYQFAADGRLLELRDRNANALTFGYTADLLTTITDTVGRTVTLGHDANDRLMSVDGPPSRSVSYEYDPSGRLATVTDTLDGVWRYAYDAADRLTSITDPNNHALVTNTYGADGRISSQTNAVDQTGTFGWDPATQTSTYTDARGGVWIDVYDGNVLQSTTDPLGNTTSYAYDAAFNRTAITDPRGNATTMTYDGAGSLLTRTAPAPLSYEESWTYTELNDVASYTDGRSNATSFEYDAVGNVIQTTEPTGAITLFGRGSGPPADYRDLVGTSAPDRYYHLDETPGGYTGLIAGDGNTVAYYPLDETSGNTATDVVGGHDSTVGAGATLGQAPGIFDGGTSIRFDGELGQQGILVPDLNLGAGFSIEMWVYWEGFNSANQTFATLAALDSSVNGEAELRIRNSTGKLEAAFSGQSAFTSNASLSQNTWYHVAYHRATDGSEKWYINGAQDKFQAGQGTGMWNGIWRIGALSNGARRLQGRVDAVAVYTALGSVPALSHYQRGIASSDVTSQGLVATSGAIADSTALRPGDGEAVNSYGSVPMNLSATQVATIEYWANQASWANDSGILFELTANSSSNPSGFRVLPSSSNGAYRVALGDGSGGYSFPRPSASEWHHYAIVIDRSEAPGSAVLAYVDAEPQSISYVSNGEDTSGNFANDTFYLFSRGGTANFETLTTLDEASIYTRALSVEEVAEHFERPSSAGRGLLTSLTAPNGKTMTYAYDAEANLTTVTTQLGNTTTMTYDAAGRLTSVVDPRGNEPGATPADFTTTFTYDAADRLLTTTDPLGHITTNAHDPAGNLLSVTDALNHVTAYSYDAANRLTSVADAFDSVTTYVYDDVGNLISRTDPNTHATTYAYDGVSRLTTTTDPLDHAWTLTYDPAGNVATRTDANGHTTTFTYDELDRLVGVDYADPTTPDVAHAYDANGNLTTMTDGAGSETYAYDDLDRLTAVTRGTDAFGYAYDPAGNITSRTYPDTTVTTYTFDDDGRLATATADGATTTYGYDAAGNVATIATPDGYTARSAYDAAGRLAEVVHSTDADLLSRFTYQRDAVGNPTALTTREGTISYRYDDLHRLTGACWDATCPWGPGASPAPCVDCGSATGVSRPADPTPPDPADIFVTYTYDPVGNRLTEATYLGAMTYAYDDGDRLTSVTPPGQPVIVYTSDANGNSLTAGTDTFAWDAAGRLLSATVGGTTETYTYAGEGRRLSVTSGGSTTAWLWDLNHGLPHLAIERDGSGVVRRSTYGLGPIATVAGGRTAYHHADGLGSLVDVTDSSGDPLAWAEYTPFGAERTGGLAAGAPDLPFGFTGEVTDPTGLVHLRARQYDPGTGRFLSTDPVEPLLTDPYVGAYVYVRNMPTVAVDPSGRCIGPLIFLAPACIGAAIGVGSYLVSTVGANVVTNVVEQRDPLHDVGRGLNPVDAALSAGAGVAGGPIGGISYGPARVVAGAALGCGATYVSQAFGGRTGDGLETGIGCAGGAAGSVLRVSSNLGSFIYGSIVAWAQALATYAEQHLLAPSGGKP